MGGRTLGSGARRVKRGRIRGIAQGECSSWTFTARDRRLRRPVGARPRSARRRARAAARPAAAAPAAPAAATVGTRRIPKDDLDRRTAMAITQFSQRSGNRELPADMRDLVRRQVLEGLIRQELLTLEANRTGVTATVAEAEEIVKREPFFNPGGQFDPTRLQAVKTTQKATFDAAIAAVQLSSRAASSPTGSPRSTRPPRRRRVPRLCARSLASRRSTSRCARRSSTAAIPSRARPTCSRTTARIWRCSTGRTARS
ncbi:MAG: SurA N-terminal domain-containing protein [Candidatus Eisenbacteria bacterium]|nr:SurA N-terminal domain-containing protein [Candidatus Eisenbacteria bacterium]